MGIYMELLVGAGQASKSRSRAMSGTWMVLPLTVSRPLLLRLWRMR